MRDQIVQDIVAEREYQEKRGWRDEFNSAGLFAGYVANYATRWAMPACFNPEKYGFRACMVKVAALAIAAIEWFDSRGGQCHDIRLAAGVLPHEDFNRAYGVGAPSGHLRPAAETVGSDLVDRFGEDLGHEAPNPMDDERIRHPKFFKLEVLQARRPDRHLR